VNFFVRMYRRNRSMVHGADSLEDFKLSSA
jgi:hypothetical protein